MPETVANRRTASSKRRTKPSRRKKWRRILTLFALFMILAVGGVAAAVVYQLNHAIENVTKNPYETPSTDGKPVETDYESEKPLSFVLLGRDTRKGSGSLNTDVMMVAVANPKTKKVTLLSLPRDTRVKIPGYRGYHKINAVFANGEAERRQAEASGQTPTENGMTLTKKTLEHMLGIPIQHYVEVNFDGFKAVIDELGGIEVNVDRKLVYDDPSDGTHIYLEPGLQLLNGEQALGYVRHRMDNRGPRYYSSDFDRNRRQQEVVKAVVEKMTSFDGITKVLNVIGTASEYVHTDLSKDQIKGLVYDFKSFRSQDITVLENGAVWNSVLSKTLLPKENMENIRSTLMREMGVTMTADLSDAAIAEYAAAEVASHRSQQQREAAKPEQKSEKPADSQQEQPDTAKETDGDGESGTNGTTPPPDIDVLVPQQPNQGGTGEPSQPPASGNSESEQDPEPNTNPGSLEPPPSGTEDGGAANGGNGSVAPPPDIAPLPGTTFPATEPTGGEGTETPTVTHQSNQTNTSVG
ncbi:LCP family protein [Brevibacillus humidisoli]|uniref:LCP family protein n=1 Tax=Brevibacillus humidisoli TaxID=2895522 RepID=UPI001E458BD1|nr:LCP family protein [Brevibacillus humidisoli]UFJ41648.1 LCP family protein [Brevibacillus humidisoli]